MSNFYRSQKLASRKIDEMFEKAMKDKSSLSIPYTILSITSDFEVGNKFVSKRIDLLVAAYDGKAKIKGDSVEFQ